MYRIIKGVDKVKRSEKLIKAMEYFIDELSEYMGNAGCNDTDPEILDLFSKGEKIELAKKYHDWNGDQEEFDGDPYVIEQDNCLLAVLWEEIKVRINENPDN